MKKYLSVLLIASLGAPLTGCSLLDGGVSMIGISGEDLTAVTYASELAEDDQKMLSVCQPLRGYTEGTITNWGSENQTLGKSEQKQALRDVADDLQDAKEEFPEFNIFYDGVVGELAAPSSNPEGFKQLKSVCETYDAVMDSLKKNYADPVIVTPGCWSSSNPSAWLYESIDGEMRVVDFGSNLKRDETLCTDWNYPYTYEFKIPTSKAVVAIRRFKMSLYSSNKFSGYDKYRVESAEFTYDPAYDTSPLPPPTWEW